MPLPQPRTPRPFVKVSAPSCVLPEFPPRFFNPGELDILVELIRRVSPKVIVEFGCNEGRASATILKNVEGIYKYVGIDVLPGYVTQKECQRKEVPTEPGKYVLDDPRFLLMVRERGSFDLFAEDLPQMDVAFIDADHSRVGVLNDYKLAKARVRPGGIIIFHDDNGLPVVEVTETLDMLAARGAPIQHVENTWIAFEEIPK